MTSDADRFWNDIAPKYRALRGLCPMTPEEADAEFDNAPPLDSVRNSGYYFLHDRQKEVTTSH